MENESAFVAPEGVYSVTDEHKPSPAQLAAVSAGPALYPTRVTTVAVKFPNVKQGGSQGFANLLGGGSKDVKKDKEKEREKDRDKERSTRDREDGVSLSSSDTPDDTDGGVGGSQETPQNVEPSSIFASAAPVGNGKKKSVARPKHNIRTTSSTFITRIQSSEGLTKTLAAKQGDVTFLFYNTGKSFSWVEAASKAKEPLIRVTFSQYPTCHDVNTATASSERLDVIIGFATGDLVWFDPITFRYARLNKGGCISTSPCTSVRWVPNSPTLFIVSHADGTIIAYDKEREDGAFTPQDPDAPNTDASSGSDDGSSQREWDPLDNIFVTIPPWHPVTSGVAPPTGKGDKEKAAKNPVSHWRVSRRSVVDIVFSPDAKLVAAISEDGCLRVIDASQEQLLDCFASYFGALSCLAWSPDGRFIVTGGQDDLLTIFSPGEQRVVARCQGHSSFVSAVAFDDSRCDGRTYRFGSVGEDNKLILWDFSSGALHRPKMAATHHQRLSMSSNLSLSVAAYGGYGTRSTRDLGDFDGDAEGEWDASPRYHPAPSRNEVSVVQPVLVKQLEGDLPSVLQFLPKYMLTATRTGNIKLWIRPLALKPKVRSSKSGPLPDISDIT